ncbi:MAG: hypothetical protein OJF58_002113 [Enhydrobacter sp.]|nr:MAG: hypothetical protein OJF58_002113 [Enhydrobacter sp.]
MSHSLFPVGPSPLRAAIAKLDDGRMTGQRNGAAGFQPARGKWRSSW